MTQTMTEGRARLARLKLYQDSLFYHGFVTITKNNREFIEPHIKDGLLVKDEKRNVAMTKKYYELNKDYL